MNTTLIGCKCTDDIQIITVIDVIGNHLKVRDNTHNIMTVSIHTLDKIVKWLPEVSQIWTNTEAGITLKIVSKTSLDGVYLCVNNNNEEHRLVMIEYLQKNYVLLGVPVDTPQTVPTLDLQEQQTNLSEGEALLKFFATPTGQWKGYNND
jgi:hypothetical protein